MKDNELKAWELTREKGQLNFILVTGLFLYGLPMFILMAFLNKPFADGFTSPAAIVHCVLWPIAGLLFGVSMWYFSESKYKKALVKRKNI